MKLSERRSCYGFAEKSFYYLKVGQWSRGAVHGQKNSEVDIWVNYLGEVVMEPRFLTRFALFALLPAFFPSFLTRIYHLCLAPVFLQPRVLLGL